MAVGELSYRLFPDGVQRKNTPFFAPDLSFLFNVQGGDIIPRISKARKVEYSYFLNDKNRMNYNKRCLECKNACKQSFRAVVINCPNFRSRKCR